MRTVSTVTPAMRARLVMCAATGDIPPASVLRWLPTGTSAADLLPIGVAWHANRPGQAWEMAHHLANGMGS